MIVFARIVTNIIPPEVTPLRVTSLARVKIRTTSNSKSGFLARSREVARGYSRCRNLFPDDSAFYRTIFMGKKQEDSSERSILMPSMTFTFSECNFNAC